MCWLCRKVFWGRIIWKLFPPVVSQIVCTLLCVHGNASDKDTLFWIREMGSGFMISILLGSYSSLGDSVHPYDSVRGRSIVCEGYIVRGTDIVHIGRSVSWGQEMSMWSTLSMRAKLSIGQKMSWGHFLSSGQSESVRHGLSVRQYMSVGHTMSLWFPA